MNGVLLDSSMARLI